MILASTFLLATLALAGDGGADDATATFAIPWSSVDGGAAVLTGGAFRLHGTVGQPDAGLLAGGPHDLLGGFHAVQAFVGPAVLGDIDGDGVVGNIDLALLLGAWGTSGGPADLDGDGVVGNTDLAILLGAWSV